MSDSDDDPERYDAGTPELGEVGLNPIEFRGPRPTDIRHPALVRQMFRDAGGSIDLALAIVGRSSNGDKAISDVLLDLEKMVPDIFDTDPRFLHTVCGRSAPSPVALAIVTRPWVILVGAMPWVHNLP